MALFWGNCGCAARATYVTAPNANEKKSTSAITASSAIWLSRLVPAIVTSVVYDAKFLEKFLFKNQVKIDGVIFENVCNEVDKVVCYLLDEHAVIISSTGGDKVEVFDGRPFYSQNPWVMLELETDWFYQLIIPGNAFKIKNKDKPHKNIICLNFWNFICF